MEKPLILPALVAMQTWLLASLYLRVAHYAVMRVDAGDFAQDAYSFAAFVLAALTFFWVRDGFRKANP